MEVVTKPEISEAAVEAEAAPKAEAVEEPEPEPPKPVKKEKTKKELADEEAAVAARVEAKKKQDEETLEKAGDVFTTILAAGIATASALVDDQDEVIDATKPGVLKAAEREMKKKGQKPWWRKIL